MEIDLKMLGQNIRYLRQGKNLSLADLAAKSGVSKTYISALENGFRGRPNVQYLYKIAIALETTIGSTRLRISAVCSVITVSRDTDSPPKTDLPL